MSYLQAFAHFVPERIVPNAELALQLGVEPQWIQEVSGIEQRRYAAPEDTVITLGLAAAQACLAKASLSADSIGFILVSCGSPDVFCPGPASQIASLLGLNSTPAIDLPIASAGSITALILADSLAQRYENILVISTEIMSRRILLTPETKETAILFGDGAGACIVSKTEGLAQIAQTALHTDGERASAIVVHENRFSMEGVAVIRHASQKLPAVISEVLTAQQLTPEAVGTFLIHQANLNLLTRVAKTLKVPANTLFTNIQHYGNTSSASLLIAASEWQTANPNPSKPFVLAGFGAGLTWGALLAIPPT